MSSQSITNNTNQPMRWLVRGAFWTATFLAVIVALYGIAFPTFYQSIPSPLHQGYIEKDQLLIIMHVVGAGFALLFVPIQLLSHQKYLTVHRVVGRLYVVAVFVGTIGAFYMAQTAAGGMVGSVGLTLLAIIWPATTILALYFVAKGDINAHKRWITRSFALTYAAVTLRVISPFISIYFDQETTQQIVYWASWMVNLAAAEIWIRRAKF